MLAFAAAVVVVAVAANVNSYLDSLDEPVVAVLLGKEAVYRAMYGRGDKGQEWALQAQQDLDTTIQNVSGAFRLLGLKEGGARGCVSNYDLTMSTGTSISSSSFGVAFTGWI